MPAPLATSRPAAAPRTSASAISGLQMTEALPKIEREPVYGLRPNEKGGIWVPQRARPRRNRKNEPIRSMTRENRYRTSAPFPRNLQEWLSLAGR